MSDDDVVMDDCLIDHPGVVGLPEQVGFDDDPGANMDIQCNVLWDEVSVLRGIWIWKPV